MTKGCLQNFSFLGIVEVGYLWLETKQQQKTTTKQISFRGYLSPQLEYKPTKPKSFEPKTFQAEHFRPKSCFSLI